MRLFYLPEYETYFIIYIIKNFYFMQQWCIPKKE